MTELPVCRPKAVVKALKRAGRQLVRQKGSHAHYKKDGMPSLVTVPMHNQDIPGKTLRSIIKSSGMSVDEFIGLL